MLCSHWSVTPNTGLWLVEMLRAEYSYVTLSLTTEFWVSGTAGALSISRRGHQIWSLIGQTRTILVPYWLVVIPHVLSCVCISWWHLGNGSDLKYAETRPDWRIVWSRSDFPSSVVKHHRYLWTVSKTVPWETPAIAQNIWCQVTRVGVDFLSPVYRPRPTDRGVTVILLSSSSTTGESRQLACCGAMPCNIHIVPRIL